MAISGVFFKTNTVLASCNPASPQVSQPPNITSISNPVGTFNNPVTIPIVISGQVGYLCEGNPGGGLGWDSYSASVEYTIKNSAGTIVLQDFWNSDTSCHVPICLPRPINVNVSVNASSLSAGTYTLEAVATGPSGDGDPNTTPPYNTDSASSSFTITRNSSAPITGSGTAQLAIFDTSLMTGSLSSSSYSCAISVNQSSCPVTLTWSVTNPDVVGGTKITSNTNDSGGVSANFQVTPPVSTGTVDAGTKTSVSVPYSSRTFFLYNNSKSLVPTSPSGSGITVTSSCISGTTWNGTTCQYDFNSPTNLTASCTDTSGTFTWNLPIGYDKSYLRINEQDGVTAIPNLYRPDPNWVYNPALDTSVAGTGLTTFTLPAGSFVSGQSYRVVVLTRDPNNTSYGYPPGNWSDSVEQTFTCGTTAPAVCAAKHYSCDAGYNPAGSATGGNNVSGVSKWSWICTNDVSPVSCSELKKKPKFIEN